MTFRLCDIRAPRRADRSGFTLIEIIIAVAIVAILAGAVTPLAFRELVKAREESTEQELAGIKSALLEFYEDTGRFPSEAEGLDALLTDPGVTGWQGPYIGGDSGDPATELGNDAFSQPYVYDLAPTTNPSGAADLIVASGGKDGTFSMGSLNHTWVLSTEADDLLMFISTGPVNRDKSRDCETEIGAIAQAARDYFADNAAFPTTLADLAPDYMDAGINSGAFVDPWNNAYVLASSGGFGTPVVLTVRSFGPDRTNDNGGDDDLSFSVSSVPPGRETTDWKLDIAQTALNNNPSLSLTGAWATDRSALGLSTAFINDGWGNVFAVNVTSRTVYSVGPDGNGALISDNIPPGVGP